MLLAVRMHPTANPTVRMPVRIDQSLPTCLLLSIASSFPLAAYKSFCIEMKVAARAAGFSKANFWESYPVVAPYPV